MSHGRTVFEDATGHRMKTQLSCFCEAVFWRAKGHVGALNKYDSEWADRVYLGVSSMDIGALIGTKNGIVKADDYRTAPAGRWSRQLVLDVATSFEQYVLPTNGAEVVVIYAQAVVPEGAPHSNCRRDFYLLADLEWSGPTFSEFGTVVDVPGACICKLV